MQRAVTSELDAVESRGVASRAREAIAALARRAFRGRSESARVTALARENERLREEVRHLREAVEHGGRLSALGTLAASIAHEIRNPLVSVCTFFQLAPHRWHDREFAQDFRALAEKEVLRISDLVTELLSVAKPPVRTMEDVDVDNLIARTVMLLTPQARRQRVRLEHEGAGRATVVHGAADQLKQVLINIVLNAIEATPAGGTVTVVKSETAGASRRVCRIEVRDTGAGIPPHLHAGIFAPFLTTKPGGTGLGLSIARQIVAEHDGCISFQTCVGEGTRFLIELPAA